jgi:hypothetical protein
VEAKTVTEDNVGGRKDGSQIPLTHEGAAPDAEDGNECADDKVRILQPDGQPVPRWRERRTTGT